MIPISLFLNLAPSRTQMLNLNAVVEYNNSMSTLLTVTCRSLYVSFLCPNCVKPQEKRQNQDKLEVHINGGKGVAWQVAWVCALTFTQPC
jgi:hypothetical protein